MLRQTNAFTSVAGPVVALQMNIITMNTSKPALSPDPPSNFTTPTITSVIVPYYEITSANITIMSPSASICVTSPASFSFTLHCTCNYTAGSSDSTAAEQLQG